MAPVLAIDSRNSMIAFNKNIKTTRYLKNFVESTVVLREKFSQIVGQRPLFVSAFSGSTTFDWFFDVGKGILTWHCSSHSVGQG